ncbi:FAD-dependent oxidoreductase [Amycolatopsis japonica]|uniref:FAD-dependent oxidoreductase n=1 Tax=Amycolatopsis japonica TaxID=208439 RepID=UPI00366E01E4
MSEFPRRIAVVGAGPAGLYTAQALLTSNAEVSVDVFDRLPTPYGLLRYGVAPDHFKIKSIARALGRPLKSAAARFYGNVTVGMDIDAEDLRRHYDAVVYATGAQRGRRLDIPGEDLPGSAAASDFVSWYNGHPYAANPLRLDSTRAVAIIGAGNVALDVARMLLSPVDRLADTDMPNHVLHALARSQVTDVHLVARRGPAEARFTTPELREIGELPGVETVVRAADLAGLEVLPDDRNAAGNCDLLGSWAARATAPPTHRRLHFRFHLRPTRVSGHRSVEALRCADPQGQRAETLPVQAVLRSVGYRSTSIAGLPFDQRAGTIPHDAGRVTDASGTVLPGLYVVGWIKRGPTGVIGTNKADAADTAKAVLADLPGLPRAAHDGTDGLAGLLERRQVAYVTREGWERLDRLEEELGARAGRPRVKVTDLSLMLATCRGEETRV